MIATDDFKTAMLAAGLTPPTKFIDDGKLHRCSGNGKAGDKAGWYVLHIDGVPAGSFGDWRTGLAETWCAKSNSTMSEAEREAHKQRIKAMEQAREAELLQRHTHAASEAQKRWEAAKSASENHPYLVCKGIKAHGIKQEGDSLVIRILVAGAVTSLQTIAPDGTKMFMPGGEIKGGYFSIGRPAGEIVICEGFATGASIHEATGSAVAISFNAGNLGAVAGALRFKFPDLKIIVAADDDIGTDGNPGLTKATAAAQAVGGYLAVPDFGQARPDGASDFNDLHQISGLEAVRSCIDAATVASVATVAVAKGTDWPELQDLVSKTEALPYPADALPTSIRTAVLEVAGFVQAPLPLIVQSAIAALSLAIQGHYDVKRADKLTGPCSLFMWAIADSGERKSSADGYFTRAIRDYEERQREIAKPLLREYQSALDAWKAQRGGVQEKIKELAKKGLPNHDQVRQLQDLDKCKPIAPLVPRLIYSDATPEALASSMVHGWPSGGILSNEAGIVLNGAGMGKDNAMRNMARLNSLWDGFIPDTTRVTTASYGATTARLTMSLQVQEATIRQFFADTKGLARGTGFLARFLVAWPQSTQGTRFFREAPANWPALATFNNRLSAILDREAPVDQFGKLTPAMLDLSPSAKALWVKFHDTIETELSANGELADIRDVGSKIADNAARLAALFHVFNGDIGSISADTMESATQIVTWHLLEAKRFLSEIALPPELANPARLEAWLIDYCKREGVDKAPTRDVQRMGPNGLRDKSVILEAVNELAELGRARLIQDGKKKLIQVRTELLKAAT